jgi:HD-GYP domain-containing protein (c-di-GMP phosphodiesterase class II)
VSEFNGEQVRTAEVVASLCLATDLGMGFPFEHGLQSTLTAMRLCGALGVDSETASNAYYVNLLAYSGCTVEGVERSLIFGGSLTEHNQHRQFGSLRELFVGVTGALPSPDAPWPRQVYQTVTRLPRAVRFMPRHFNAFCEVAGMLAERLGMPESFSAMFPLLTERWDGAGVLRRAKGDDVPLPIRIFHVARDATYQRLMGDDDHVVSVIRARAGHAFDPEVVAAFMDNPAEILGPPDPPESVWNEVLDAEPKPRRTLENESIDRALAAIGTFSEFASPFLSGHSSGVAELAGSAAVLHGFEPADATMIRRAAYVHDVGRTAVHPRIWDKAGPLSADEREQVRLHPYHTERVLAHSPYLARLASIACAHHERLDGSGYHRALPANALPPTARLLAAADAFRSKTEPRPYRPAMSPEDAAADLSVKASRGFFDPEMVATVVEAAGLERPAVERPAGLTEREVQVLRLLARGMKTKQIARELRIAVKTADKHIENAYRKIGVSSRAAATLFATEHGLVR